MRLFVKSPMFGARPSFLSLAGIAILISGFWGVSCGAPGLDGEGDTGEGGEPNGESSSSESSSSGDDTANFDLTAGGASTTGSTTGIDLINSPPTEGCADGVRDVDEACDDGNSDPGDGCPSNCRFVEPGYVCPDAGKPCQPFSICGDGVVVAPEQCDDGETQAGDGCNDICQVEVGFKCQEDANGLSSCDATVCGDGKQEGAETCDDGNTLPFDGCSPICQAEPECSTLKGCSSSCGDGVVVGDEECDDGNAVGGDGCSAECEQEPGYTCSQPQECELVDEECVLRLPILFRDFMADHADFHNGGGQAILDLALPELVDGRPVLNPEVSGSISSAESFEQWYTDNEENETIGAEIVLFDSGGGTYVNRLNNLGERYVNRQGEQLDGNPLFLPIDDQGLPGFEDEMSPATVPEQVYGGGWSYEDETLGSNGPQHNFRFTSEIAYWFEYHEGDAFELVFDGDDDVWVYVNGKLAVDLGGLHVPMSGSFELEAGVITTTRTDYSSNQTTSQEFGLDDFGIVDGGVYEIKVFHAERNPTGSSYRLTLGGFNTARSRCESTCGDGILTAGEMCDEGEDNTPEGQDEHNRCSFDCRIAAYCGDGIKQGEEECDDNDETDPNVASCQGCRYLLVR